MKATMVVQAAPTLNIERLITTELQLHPLETFDRFPFDVVREAFLKLGSCGSSFINTTSEELHEWLEGHISQLLAIRDPFWDKLLDWYLFRENFRPTTSPERAIDFAIRIWLKTGAPQLPKAIVAAIKRTDNRRAYWHVPNMEAFILRVISDMNGDPQRIYAEAAWANFVRIVELVQDERDLLMLPHLESVLELLKSKTIRMEYPKNKFVHSEQTHFLETRLEDFRWEIGVQKGSTSRLEEALWTRVGKAVPMPVEILISAPKEAAADHFVTVGFQVKSDSPDNTHYLQRALKNFTINASLVGFSQINDHLNAESHHLSAWPSLGSNRITITVNYGKQGEIFRGSIYVHGIPAAD